MGGDDYKNNEKLLKKQIGDNINKFVFYKCFRFARDVFKRLQAVTPEPKGCKGGHTLYICIRF